MVRMIALAGVLILLLGFSETAMGEFETDTFKSSKGDLKITFIGHGTLMFEFAGKVIHVDPVGQYADYARLPKANLAVVTHEHRDHLDAKALETIRTEKTAVILTQACAAQVSGGQVMKNGEVKEWEGVKIEAVPAYNLVHMRSEGVPYHPKGNGNGYVFTFGDQRVYVAGDTENTPEMKALQGIDVAFLPMNLPFTMTPEMVADAARGFKPRVLYPYHFGETDTGKIVELLKDAREIEVRIRKLK
jgi:L-ascorbate metabolism protein UlaG (beta-lactamase superfamily)